VPAAGPDQHYGKGSAAPGQEDADDMDVEEVPASLPEDPQLQAKIERVLTQLTTDARERVDELFNLVQGSFEWSTARAIRLTTANFFKVHRRQGDCHKLVFELLYRKAKTDAMKHGNDTEPFARKNYEKKRDVSVQTCGLVVDQTHHFLAASPGKYIVINVIIVSQNVIPALIECNFWPDGLIGDETLIEFKCPTSGAEYPSAEEAVRAGKVKLTLHLWPYKGSDGTSVLRPESDGLTTNAGRTRLFVRSRLEKHFPTHSHVCAPFTDSSYPT
jgi:hypothetical protein